MLGETAFRERNSRAEARLEKTAEWPFYAFLQNLCEPVKADPTLRSFPLVHGLLARFI
jgi:hypothetical protein